VHSDAHHFRAPGLFCCSCSTTTTVTATTKSKQQSAQYTNSIIE